jgi:glycosyltransferase involved in cell wall biosynthesis
MEMLKKNLGREGVLIRSTFSPNANVVHSGGESILWVGTIRDIKNPAMFLDIAARLPEHRFVMVGGVGAGGDKLMETVQARAGEIPNLTMTGAVAYHEVGRYFGKAKLLVNTSHAEGFPNTFMQAWYNGTPVVSTVDPDQLLTRHGLGRHCRNLDEMTDAVREFAETKDLRHQTGERARDYVVKNHNLDVVVSQYDELFLRLCPGSAK